MKRYEEGGSFDIQAALVMILGCVVCALMTGCGSSTGWTVSFGVAPVHGVDTRQQLSPEGSIKLADLERRKERY